MNLYNQCKTREEKAYLNQKIGDEDKQQTYRTIGEQAPVFLSKLKSFPESQESLKTLARAGEKKILTLIEKGKVTSQSSVAEVRAEVRKLLNGDTDDSRETTGIALDPLQHVNIVVGRSEPLKWSDVESFKTDLTELLKKHKLTLHVDGFKNLHQHISKTAEKYETAAAAHWDKILTRSEKAIARLIHQEYQKRVKAQYPKLKGRKFTDAAARRRAAEKLTGFNRDEVCGGVLSSDELLRIDENQDVTPDTSDGTHAILAGAAMLGISPKAIAKSVRDARNSVKESERLKTLQKDYERIVTMMKSDDADMSVNQFKTMHQPRRLKKVN